MLDNIEASLALPEKDNFDSKTDPQEADLIEAMKREGLPAGDTGDPICQQLVRHSWIFSEHQLKRCIPSAVEVAILRRC